MADRRTSDDIGASEVDPTVESDPATDRRSFLRHLSRETVSTAGRVAGWSTVVRRSVVAAGEAAIVGLDPPIEPEPEVAETPEPAIQPPTAAAPAPAPIGMTTERDAVAALSVDQHAFLDAMSMTTLAVNDPSGHPQVTSSSYHWDGTTFRLPGRQFTLRTSNLERDPRVSLFIDDRSSGASVAISGVAALVYGDDVEPGMLQILARDRSLDDARGLLDVLRAEGDLILIQVRPTRFVWRSA